LVVSTPVPPSASPEATMPSSFLTPTAESAWVPARSGTSLVDCLRVHADEARRRRREQETKRARSVGVKSVQPLALCFLPAFVLIGVVPLVASLLGTFTGR